MQSENRAKATHDLLAAQEETKDTLTLLSKLQTEFQQFKREAEIDKVQTKEAAEIAAAELGGLEGENREIVVLKTTSTALRRRKSLNPDYFFHPLTYNLIA